MKNRTFAQAFSNTRGQISFSPPACCSPVLGLAKIGSQYLQSERDLSSASMYIQSRHGADVRAALLAGKAIVNGNRYPAPVNKKLHTEDTCAQTFLDN